MITCFLNELSSFNIYSFVNHMQLKPFIKIKNLITVVKQTSLNYKINIDNKSPGGHIVH